MAKKAAPKGDFVVTVETASLTRTGTGKDVFQALDALGLDYTQLKEKGTITLEHGGKKASRFYYLAPLRRIVSSKLRKAQVGKDLMYLLK